jgi:thiol:disulfide interchange protein DsbD
MKKWLLVFICCLAVTGHANPPPSSQIVQLSVASVDPNTFAIKFQIKPNYFLYSDRIKLIPDANNHVLSLGTLRFPPTTKKVDKQGNIYTVYRNDLSIPVGVLGNKPGKTQLTLNYQGCSDDGFCYAPEKKTIELVINEQLALSQVNIVQPDRKMISSTEQNSDFSKIFMSHNWLLILLTFYGFGLLLSFTPCILPMVPVLSGIIIGHGKDISTSKAFFLSLSYVLSMSITYAFLGAIVALLGANLQISMQSPWSIGLFSLIFILLALSMFGFYEFKLPHSWQARIGSTSQSQLGGHYLGAAIMGCLSTLILSPCVTAPLIGVLTYIAQTKNVLLGCITLFVLSMGMGTPLLLIGTSAGKLLPETGSWMNVIKYVFGILFLAVAIELLSRISPSVISMGLWASLLIFSGIYSGALTYSTTNRQKFNQGVGLILLIYGFLILIGASLGATNPVQPLTLVKKMSNDVRIFKQERSQTLSSLKQKIIAARGKPVMLDFYADWCTSCKIMETITFTDPRIEKILAYFTVIKVDVTANTKNNQAILNYFNVVAPPTLIFFNAQGQQLDELKLVGESSPEELLSTLNQIIPSP